MDKEVITTIKVPNGIETMVDAHHITIKTDKGEQKREFKSHRIVFEKKGNDIVIIGSPVNKQTRALMNTFIAHIQNMVIGMTFGYKYDLKITYSHFPMTAEIKNDVVYIKNFLGEKFPREARIVGATKVEIKGQDITVTGFNKEEVGQTATNIEQAAKVRGRDIRRFTDGVYLEKKGNIEEVPEDFGLQKIRGRE